MSLRADPCAGLRKFENLIENKHMDTNQTHETSTPDADICGGLRTMSGQENQLSIGFASRDEAIARLCVKVFGATPAYADEQPAPETIEPIGLPVWNGIGQPGGVMPLRGCPALLDLLKKVTGGPMGTPAERPTSLSERMRSHLHMQFPATVGHIPLTAMLAQVADLERERDNALSDFRQADTDSIRALHERNEAREQRDRLAECLDHLRKKNWFRDGLTGRDVICCLDPDKVRAALAFVDGGTL